MIWFAFEILMVIIAWKAWDYEPDFKKAQHQFVGRMNARAHNCKTKVRNLCKKLRHK